ncbi:hypothetical protein MTO96_016660 [Rhipicephalus appendiculatus]
MLVSILKKNGEPTRRLVSTSASRSPRFGGRASQEGGRQRPTPVFAVRFPSDGGNSYEEARPASKLARVPTRVVTRTIMRRNTFVR